MSLTYKSAGVDLDVYAESMSRLPRLAAKTFNDRVLRLDGGFAGLFRLGTYRDPVLVSCTDGVGTKLKIAVAAGRNSTIGIDLVAMSVNDAICCGATPLFFLDYVAMAKDDPDLLEMIVGGIVDGCQQSGCALLGGETAIMPDLYHIGDYDLAGFCVGVVERDDVIDGKSIQRGNKLIALPSSGLHSNGYSLARKVVFEAAQLKLDDVVAETKQTVADLLLEPTRIYVRIVLDVLEKFKANVGVRGIAHITGGGLHENLSRIVPEGFSLNIDDAALRKNRPFVFDWLQKLGDIADAEMARVFNCGLGLVFVVDADSADAIVEHLHQCGESPRVVGEIV
ncbi:MAG: phosphoribosylformylglycinamidine cyclo-ligase [Thermoguttaceae bacterium]